jgi:hypothetical protein
MKGLASFSTGTWTMGVASSWHGLNSWGQAARSEG